MAVMPAACPWDPTGRRTCRLGLRGCPHAWQACCLGRWPGCENGHFLQKTAIYRRVWTARTRHQAAQSCGHRRSSGFVHDDQEGLHGVVLSWICGASTQQRSPRMSLPRVYRPLVHSHLSLGLTAFTHQTRLHGGPRQNGLGQHQSPPLPDGGPQGRRTGTPPSRAAQLEAAPRGQPGSPRCAAAAWTCR